MSRGEFFHEIERENNFDLLKMGIGLGLVCAIAVIWWIMITK